MSESTSPNVPGLSARQWLILIGSVLLATRIMTVATMIPQNARPRTHFASAMFSANDRSRWITVRSLVEQQTFEIDDIIAQDGWGTIDMVRHPPGGENAHFYSSKPPFLSVLVAGLYWPCYHLLKWDLINQHFLLVRSFLLIVNFVPLVLAWIVMNRIIERESTTEFARTFALASLIFGSYLTTFSVTLNNHTPAACALMFALGGVWKIFREDSIHWGWYACAGFWGAFVVCCELPAAAFFAILGLLIVWRSPLKGMAVFVPAALIPLGLFLYTNLLATGSIKPFYTGFGTELYNYTYRGRGSYWLNPVGIDKSRDPFFVYLFHCLVGHHGVFSLTPVSLLTILSLWGKGRVSRTLGVFQWLTAVVSVVVIGFYLTKTQSYNYGGHTSGLRWTFWLIPAWTLGMLPALERFGGNRLFRIVSLVLLAVGVFSVHWPMGNPWQHPWLFVLLEQWHVIDYAN